MRRSYAGQKGQPRRSIYSGCSGAGRGGCCALWIPAYGERLTGALQINFVSLRVSHDICIKAAAAAGVGVAAGKGRGKGTVFEGRQLGSVSHACRSCQ